jgi:predicted AAA+ superfamily ATPase
MILFLITRKRWFNKEIKFNFMEDILPSDINVLIGVNGIGKTYTLKVLIDFLLEINIGIKEIRERKV